MEKGTVSNGTNALCTMLRPLLAEVTINVNNSTLVQTQEILLLLGRLETRIALLEKLVSEKKKPAASRVTRAVAKTTTGQVDQPPAKTKFPINKLVYFRHQFKTSPEYREKYISAEMQELMDNDETIKSKANEAQKLVAQTTFCWNYIKAQDKEKCESQEKEYIAAKAAHASANKPAQEVPEDHTPVPVQPK